MYMYTLFAAASVPHVAYADVTHHCSASATIANLYPPVLNGAKNALSQWSLGCTVFKMQVSYY